MSKLNLERLDNIIKSREKEYQMPTVTKQVGDVSKTYTPLTEIPTGHGLGKTLIGKCSAILPNRLQCWRAGDFVVTEVHPAVTDADEKVSQQKDTYQLCRSHVAQQQENDEKTKQEATASANDAQQQTTETTETSEEQKLNSGDFRDFTNTKTTTEQPLTEKPLAFTPQQDQNQ